MHICHLTGSVSRLAGGPFNSIRRLAQEQARTGHQVDILGVGDSRTEEDIDLWSPVRPTIAQPFWPQKFGYNRSLKMQLHRLRPSLLHNHGIWMYHTCLARRYKERNKTPFLLSPRGMLEPWAWRNSRWKKRPLWLLWEHRNVRAANLLHATSEQEAEHLRRRGFNHPIAILANGVDLPGPRTFRKKTTKTALFLSRLHPKKGLPGLITAWARIRPAGWQLCIAGPDENGHQNEVRALIRRFQLEDTIHLLGPAYGNDKKRLYRDADLFILPTLSENFGIVVAEALAHGIPVITTTGAPWQELKETQSGWWVSPDPSGIGAALQDATNRSDADLFRMGENGRKLVTRRYSWPKISHEMCTVYEYLIHDTQKPSCIHTT